jgi:hypothetical protein
MHRRVVWLALGLIGPSGAAVALAGCGNGDDASSALVDAASDGTKPDSTTQGGGQDATPDQTADEGTDSGRDAGPCELVEAGVLDDAAVAAGFDLVANTYKCWRCHQNGPPDAGLTLDGRDASIMDGGLIFPPNLTTDRTGLGCWTNGQISNAFLNGIAPDGGDLCVMPKFGKVTNDAGTEPIDAATAAQIVEFLRTLAPVEYRAPNTVCPAAPSDGGGGDAGDAASDSGEAADGAGGPG